MENVVINITNNADVVTINISEGSFLNCADLDNCANFQTVVLGLSDEIADRTDADQNLQTQIDNLPAPVSQDLQSVTANGANTTNQMQINGVNVATVNDILTKLLTGLSITGSSILATDNVLEAFGKLQNQIAGLLGGALPQGVWNASTNTPALASGVGTTGHYYVVNVAGTTTIDGVNDWKVGDWIWFVNGVWHKVDNTDAVSSVNGLIGAVSLVSGDIPESGNLYYTSARFDTAFASKTTNDLTENTNLYFTDARARTAVIASSITDGDTTHSPSGDVIFDALALKEDAFSKETGFNLPLGTSAGTILEGDKYDLMVRVIAKDLSVTGNHTGTVATTLIKSILVSANTVTVNDRLEINSRIEKNNSIGTSVQYIYYNTSNSLSGATLISTQSGALRWFDMTRNLNVHSATETSTIAAVTSVGTDITASTSSKQMFNIDWTNDVYIIQAFALASTSDIANSYGLLATRYR